MATKTIFATEWTGGGVWGLYQIVQARYIEKITGMRMVDLTDMHISHSIGSVPANALLVPDTADTSKPQCRAEDIISPFITCAAEIFGKNSVLEHRAQGVKHDLHHAMKDSGQRLLSKIFPDLTGKLHKNHGILGDFITDHVGTIKMNKLMKSSCVIAHEMNRISRACFMTLKPDLFDENLWDNDVIRNMGDNVSVKDAIMASTAAPTIFGAHKVMDGDFVDFDPVFTALPVIEMAMDMAEAKTRRENAPDIRVKMLQITCATTDEKTGNPAAYNRQGPLGMMADLIAGMGLDVQKVEARRLKRLIGEENVTTLGTSMTTLSNTEQATLPSNDIFNGNLSNLHKIIAFAEKSVVKEHDKIMAYAEDVVETRHRESMSDPTAAFGIVANENKAVSTMTVNALPEKKPSLLETFLPFRKKAVTPATHNTQPTPRVH